MLEAGPSEIAVPGGKPLQLLTQAKSVLAGADAFHRSLKLVIYESHLLCGAGEFEQAAQVARQGIVDAERRGFARTGGAFLAINVAEPLFSLGRWDEAAAVAERALDLAPPPMTRASLWIILGWIAAARGDLDAAARRAASSRAILSRAVYDDQFHLPQAELDVALTLAADGPAAAVAAAAGLLARYDVSASSPRYVWPLLVTAAMAARRVPGDDAAALLEQLRTIAGKLEAFGPVQRAWQLSFPALAGTAPCSRSRGIATPRSCRQQTSRRWTRWRPRTRPPPRGWRSGSRSRPRWRRCRPRGRRWPPGPPGRPRPGWAPPTTSPPGSARSPCGRRSPS